MMIWIKYVINKDYISLFNLDDYILGVLGLD